MHAAAHLLDDEERAEVVEVGLAAAGGAGGADGVVAVLARADDRRVPDPPGDLPREPAGGGHRGDLPLRVHRVQVDRPGGARHHRLVAGHVEPVVRLPAIGAPGEPLLPRGRGEEVLLLEAVGEREAPGPLAHEQDVVGVLEHQLRHLARGLDPLQARHRAGPLRRSVHARGVELDHPLLVGEAPVPDRIVGGVEFLDLHPLDRRVERVRPLEHQLHRLRHRGEAVVRADGDGARGRGQDDRGGGDGGLGAHQRGAGHGGTRGAEEGATG